LAVATLQARHAAHQRPPAATDLVLPTLARDGKSIAPISGWNWLKRELDRRSGLTEWQLHDFRRRIVSICAEHGADIAVLDSLLNHASSATRPGVIGTCQRALLVEPTRKVMALWDGLLSKAIGLLPAVAAEPRLVPVAWFFQFRRISCSLAELHRRWGPRAPVSPAGPSPVPSPLRRRGPLPHTHPPPWPADLHRAR
jgi:hypothetical protein